MATSEERETVWIAQNWNRQDSYHTDPECVHLQKGNNPQPRDLSDVSDRRTECDYCAGTVPDREENPDWSFYRAAANADP